MKRILFIAATCLFCAIAVGVAQEGEAPAGEAPEGEAPYAMGPPKEIQDMAFLLGTWDARSMIRMSPDSAFQPFNGIAEYAFIAGGACLQMTYTGEFEGMPFLGLGHLTYNRNSGMWMDTWTDNVGGAMTAYVGTKQGNTLVVMGEDYMAPGVSMQTRVTTIFDTDTSYTWTIEHSTNDGKTWDAYMTSEYTKK